jgi:hypothetical protein
MALINPDSVIFTDAIVERFEPADIERLILETAEEEGRGVEAVFSQTPVRPGRCRRDARASSFSFCSLESVGLGVHRQSG